MNDNGAHWSSARRQSFHCVAVVSAKKHDKKHKAPAPAPEAVPTYVSCVPLFFSLPVPLERSLLQHLILKAE